MDTLSSPPTQILQAHSKIKQLAINTSYSYLYGIEEDITLLSSGKFEIYRIIEQDSTISYFNLYDILSFSSFGWAAPVDDDLDDSDEVDVDITSSPSAHPQRQRIRLTNFLYTSEPKILSAIDILDKDLKVQETIWELDDNTSGPLKESLLTLYTRNKLYGTGFMIG